MSDTAWRGSRDYAKWTFFALVAACVLTVVVVDERFLFIPSDPEWRHIAPFKWELLVHGPLGAVALLLGPLQFSDRLRAARPRMHRWTGRIYIAAIAVAAPIGAIVGARYEPTTIHLEQYFQGGFWFITTAMALICILSKNVQAHKTWMMKSYAFCLVFVLSRLPDVIPDYHMPPQTLADMLWGLVVAALVVPDLILTIRNLARRRTSAAKGREASIRP